MVQAQTWKHTLLIGLKHDHHSTSNLSRDQAVMIAASYITIGHQASGNNSPVVFGTKGNISEWTEREECVEAVGAGKEARPAAGAK